MAPPRWGTGYRHRPPTLSERARSALVSLAVGVDFEPTTHPPFPELFRRYGPLNQGRFNACTGCAVAMGATLAAAAAGHDLPSALSPLIPYWAARRKRAGSDEFVQDDGAYLDDVVWAFNWFGASDDKSSQGLFVGLRADMINARPPPSEFREALRVRSQLQLRMRPIVAERERLVQLLAHSLHLGRVCFVALPVGDSFLEPRQDVIGNQIGQVLGYHFVCLLDWRKNDFGQFELQIGNSWGRLWADQGTAWASRFLIKQAVGAFYLEPLRAPEAA